MKQIYLDHAAATPVLPKVQKAMEPYLVEQFYNPSATYLAARAVRRDIEAARGWIAGWLGARPGEVIFTAGGTEANNLAIHGVMSRHPGANIVVSSIEHEAVLTPAHGYDCREVPVKPDGIIDLKALEAAIDDKTVLVSVMYVNNELGTIEPIREVSRIVKSKVEGRKSKGLDLPLYLHTDAAQAGNYLDLHVSRLGVDLMTINSGKIYGPKQCGALYVRSGIQLQPLIDGGGQERGLRSGTENVAGVTGFAKALDSVQSVRREEAERLKALQKLFYEELATKLPAAVVNGSREHRLPNNVHVTIPGHDNERLMMELDERGIQCAVGSACSASSEEPSHVLNAIGLTEAEARASLRFSMGRGTRAADIRRTVSTLAGLAR